MGGQALAGAAGAPGAYAARARLKAGEGPARGGERGRDLHNKPRSAVSVLALELGREFLGRFPAGARGTRQRAAERRRDEEGQHSSQEVLRGKTVICTPAFTYSKDFTSEGPDAPSDRYGFSKWSREGWMAFLLLRV